MVGRRGKSRVSAAQRPGPNDSEVGINSRPSQARGAENRRLAAVQPLRYGFERAAQITKWRNRRIQVAAPAAQGGRGGLTIGVFEWRGSVFPGTGFYKAAPQRCAARHQAVLGIGQGENREEANRDATLRVLAFTAAVADPVVTAVMRLLRSPAEALDGVGPTQRTPLNNLTRTSRPVGTRVAIIARTWDNRNRRCFRALSLSGSCEDARSGREPFLLPARARRITQLTLWEDWPVKWNKIELDCSPSSHAIGGRSHCGITKPL